MPDMNTLKITYLSETPFKTVDFLILASIVAIAIYGIVFIIKSIKNKDEDYAPFSDHVLPVLGVYMLLFFYFLFAFEAPYADVSVKVIPNMDVREFDMNHSRDFFKKDDDYYFVKTIKTSLWGKSYALESEESLSDIIRWNIENSVSGTKGGEK